MKRFRALRLFIFFTAVAPLAMTAPEGAVKNSWWYRTPATKYWEGLPLSNGRLAVMVPGRIRDEAIAINDETLFTGSPYDPNNLEGPKVLAEVRKLLLEGKFVEAQKRCQELMSRPLSVQHYRPLGEMRVRFDMPDRAASYRRELDMDSAVARVTFESGGIHYTREVFASYPDQVLVMRITADKPGKRVSFSTHGKYPPQRA